MIATVTEKESQMAHMLHTCSEALKAVTAEKDALKQRQEGDALSIRCYQEQVDDMTKERDALKDDLAQAQLHIKHIGNDALRKENAALKAALVSFTKSDYIKKHHPKRYAAAVAALKGKA